MTLIHGAGVLSAPLRTVEYSRPRWVKPPRPLKNSIAGLALGDSAGGGGGIRLAGGGGQAGTRSRARLICSESVPRLPCSTARAAAKRSPSTSEGSRSARSTNTEPRVSSLVILGID